MKEYRTLKIVTVAAGEVGLTDRQASRRAHLLKPTKKKGVYEALAPLTFKAGEVVFLPNMSKADARFYEEIAAKPEAKGK